MYLASKIFSIETEFRIPRSIHNLFLGYFACLVSLFGGTLITKIELDLAKRFINFLLNSPNLVIGSQQGSFLGQTWSIFLKNV